MSRAIYLPTIDRSHAPGARGAELYRDGRTGNVTVGRPDGSRTDLERLPRLGAAQGDMLAYTGTQWRRVGLGDSGRGLVADTTQAAGVRWADVGCYPWVRRPYSWLPDGAAGTLAGVGYSAATPTGAGAVYQAAGGCYIQRTGLGVLNQAGGWAVGGVTASEAICQRRHSPVLAVRLVPGALVGITLWVGLWAWTSTGGVTSASTGGGAAHAALRYVQGTDATWIASVHSGGAQSTSAMSAAPADGTEQLLRVTVDSAAGAVRFRVGESGSDVAISTNLPATTTDFGWVCYAVSQGAAAGVMRVASTYLESA